MIKINDNFAIDRDANNWILRHTWTIESKSGKTKGQMVAKERLRYFGTLRQLCHYTLDLGIEGTTDMAELLKSLNAAHRDLDCMLTTHSQEMKRLFNGKGLFDGQH